MIALLLWGILMMKIVIRNLGKFCETYNLKYAIKPICFKKKFDNPSCINLTLTNHYNCFQDLGTLETGLSHIHDLTYSVLKSYFLKQKLRIIKYRDYAKFHSNTFRAELVKEFSLRVVL